MFRDRIDAGQKLAQKLEEYKSLPNIVILGLPRGGLPVASIIAQYLGAPLDIIITRKIGHPYNDEFALGAISEYGSSVFGEDLNEIDPEWVRNEVKNEEREIKRRKKLYLGNKKRVDLKNKIVIVVDDGAATGLTLIAALRGIREMYAEKIIAAVPVIPTSTAREVKKYVDEIVTLQRPGDETFYGSVGAYYENFTQVEDAEVKRILKHNWPGNE